MYYECSDTTKMLPSAYDIDSNYKMEIYCVDGVFDTSSGWPTDCETKSVCETVPEPPADKGLERSDDRTTFRQGEQAYFTCSDPAAVLNDISGLNMFDVECPEGAIAPDALDFPADPNWIGCVVHPTCTNLPVPSDESKLNKSSPTESVRVGEYVHYTCIDKADFFETPSVSEN